MARGVFIARAVSALAMLLVFSAFAYLLMRPVSGAVVGLMRLELLLLTGFLAVCVLFFERVAIRIIRTRGGKLRGPPQE